MKMINLKLSSKMHIMITVSAIIIAIGLAMGLIFQFTAGGYFNYGAENSSYQTVVVDYAVAEFSDGDDVLEICDEAFSESGVKYYSTGYAASGMGGIYTFSFDKKVSADDLIKATSAINETLISEPTASSNASYHNVETELGSFKGTAYAAIAVSAAIVFQFVYFAIRYHLTMAFSALLADVHNLAIFISLLAITRVPIGSSVAAFGALTVLITMLGCCVLFGNMRSNLKDEKFAQLGAFEQVDSTASESLFKILLSCIGVALAAVLLFVLLAISALSVQLLISPIVLALLSVCSCVYGTAFFTPSIYSRFKTIGDNFKAKHSQKSKNS